MVRMLESPCMPHMVTFYVGFRARAGFHICKKRGGGIVLYAEFSVLKSSTLARTFNVGFEMEGRHANSKRELILKNCPELIDFAKPRCMEFFIEAGPEHLGCCIVDDYDD